MAIDLAILYILPVMKILNRYILQEHIPPFIFAVFLITFLLVLELIPRIVEMVIDKNLSVWIVLELIFLNLAWMVALSVPMAVLVATLLTFGRLTADSEIVAIKTSGVNLLRILIPLMIAAGLLTYVMIQFSDKVLPELNHRSRLLTGDIRAMRPTLSFRPGVFITDISGYIILIDEIDHTTSEVKGVRITETKNPNAPRIIVAKSGLMKFIDNGRTVQFTLRDGEIHMLDAKQPANYQKVDFTEQVINIGGVGSELKRSESSFRGDREMNIAMMNETVSKAKESMIPFRERIKNSLAIRINRLFKDTLVLGKDTPKTTIEAFKILDIDTKGTLRKLRREADQLREQQKIINKYQIEIYKKYSIPAAAFAFVLIGAPLGILSRKGGMGVAVSFSLIIFTIYWAFLIGGEDLSDRGMISPFWGMWSANILIGIIGLYLLVKVITEKPLFAFFRKN